MAKIRGSIFIDLYYCYDNNNNDILSWDFEIQTDHQISARRPDLIIINNNNKEKWTGRIVDFALAANHRVKLKEYEKRDKNLNLDRELKSYGTWKWQ